MFLFLFLNLLSSTHGFCSNSVRSVDAGAFFYYFNDTQHYLFVNSTCATGQNIAALCFTGSSVNWNPTSTGIYIGGASSTLDNPSTRARFVASVVDSNKFTLEAWISLPRNCSTDDCVFLRIHESKNSTQVSFSISVIAGKLKYFLLLRTPSGTICPFSFISRSGLQQDLLYHVVFSVSVDQIFFDPAYGFETNYRHHINGILQTEDSKNLIEICFGGKTFIDAAIPAIADWNSEYQLTLGSPIVQNGSSPPYLRVYLLSFYGRVLSETEITRNFKSGIPSSRPVAFQAYVDAVEMVDKGIQRGNLQIWSNLVYSFDESVTNKFCGDTSEIHPANISYFISSLPAKGFLRLNATKQLMPQDLPVLLLWSDKLDYVSYASSDGLSFTDSLQYQVTLLVVY